MADPSLAEVDDLPDLLGARVFRGRLRIGGKPVLCICEKDRADRNKCREPNPFHNSAPRLPDRMPSGSVR